MYGLLNFYRKYILSFTELVKLLCQLLGQGAQLWMAIAGEYVCEVARHIINALHWLNADPLAELWMETRVSSYSITALLLQQHLDKLQT